MKKLLNWIWVNWLVLFYLYLGVMFMHYTIIDAVSDQIFHGVLLLVVNSSLESKK
jgi:hypothetical protein